ncbi:efflux transporter outer membrane subunit [Muribaculum sp. NM65_B17]|uniref:efflux transporter outer membrane subunit n=1 Tax=Muribaculum sp. NM65_B17 TaxID=2516961 RepID=UPI001093BDB0|nr:efflux transporter outer membrane subunit [Muribaculum sp. NM65_B17]TGY04967.1 efflux transporter outer membrane subunit [Muribaculum sp. NM65_B17]THG44796.1 efflux transporter outer membrane subunit [Muribaculaceae bacterium]
MKKIIIPALMAAIVSSCGVYKKYERPEISVPESYRDIDTPDTTTLASLSWRELFTEPELQALIDTALVNNTDLSVARLKVKEAEAALFNARLSYLPSVGLNAEGGVARFDGSTSKTYNIGANASWELDIFGKMTNAKRGAVAALESSEAYRQAVQSQLIATVANSYYTLSMLDAQLGVNIRTLETWRKTVRTMEALKKAGKSNDAAVLQAQANVLSLESSLLALQKSINQTENSLYALIGISDYPEIRRGRLVDAVFPESLVTGVPLQLLANRPDVRQAERNLAQAFYATNVARAAFYPSISLSGTIGWTNNGGGIVANPGQWLLNAIGSLTQPLFNRGANIANLRIAEAQQEEAKLLFRQSLLDAGREVNDALAALQVADNQITTTDSRVETLKEAVRKTELLMRHSPMTYLEVLTAQQSLLDAELTALQSRYDRIQSIITLYHALGGGK